MEGKVNVLDISLVLCHSLESPIPCLCLKLSNLYCSVFVKGVKNIYLIYFFSVNPLVLVVVLYTMGPLRLYITSQSQP